MRKILMVSTSYPRNAIDWRGLFIQRLVEALALRSEIRLALWSPPGEQPDTIEYACTRSESIWLNELMDRGGIASILRSGGTSRVTTPITLLRHLRQVYKRSHGVDLFHINWLQNALALWRIPGKQSALISVLGSDMGLLGLAGMRFSLRQIFKQRPCILAPNAEWMEPILNDYFGDIAEIRAIPFGIDNKWYSLERGDEGSINCWLTVSRITKNKIGQLFKWTEEYSNKNLHEFHLFGPMQELVAIPSWINYHGPTYPQDLMDNWFPRARGLITLSNHDEGRPQVMLEAMAAGLPIIASHLPAHDNLLKHEKTGWLVSSRKEFDHALTVLGHADSNKMIGNQAREWVKQNIGTWHDCAERYMNAYRKLLGSM